MYIILLYLFFQTLSRLNHLTSGNAVDVSKTIPKKSLLKVSVGFDTLNLFQSFQITRRLDAIEHFQVEAFQPESPNGHGADGVDSQEL